MIRVKGKNVFAKVITSHLNSFPIKILDLKLIETRVNI